MKLAWRCVVVALDIQGAYDTIDHTAALWKLRQLDLPRYLVAWIRAFLQGRSVSLAVNELSAPFEIRTGVPQGSPLSPILFLVYIDDLLRQLAVVCHVQAFADDILIWDLISSRSARPPSLCHALQVVDRWSAEWGLTFSPAKSQTIDISARRDLPPLELTLNGIRVSQV